MEFNVDLNIESNKIPVNFGNGEKHFTAGFAEFQQLHSPAEVEEYTGAYEVTPTKERQILETRGKLATENIVIEPVPKNYGLITYNGFEITIS